MRKSAGPNTAPIKASQPDAAIFHPLAGETTRAARLLWVGQLTMGCKALHAVAAMAAEILEAAAALTAAPQGVGAGSGPGANIAQDGSCWTAASTVPVTLKVKEFSVLVQFWLAVAVTRSSAGAFLLVEKMTNRSRL